MAQLLALDYGKKRTGIAVTDDMQLIASGLQTVDTMDLLSFLDAYFNTHEVEKVIIGEPKQMNGLPSESAVLIENFIAVFSKKFPQMPIERIDERFTSKMAFKTMLDSGLKKRQRKNKALLDEIAATIILQDYLTYKK